MSTPEQVADEVRKAAAKLLEGKVRPKRLTPKERKARARKIMLMACDAVYYSSKGRLSGFWHATNVVRIRLGLYPALESEINAREIIKLAVANNEVVSTLNEANRLLEDIAKMVKVNNTNDEAVDMKLAAINVRLKLLEDMAAKVGKEDEGSYVQ